MECVQYLDYLPINVDFLTVCFRFHPAYQSRSCQLRVFPSLRAMTSKIRVVFTVKLAELGELFGGTEVWQISFPPILTYVLHTVVIVIPKSFLSFAVCLVPVLNDTYK